MFGGHSYKTIGIPCFPIQKRDKRTLTIPASVETIDTYAFSKMRPADGAGVYQKIDKMVWVLFNPNKLSGDYMTIPASVETIGENAFYNTGFTKFDAIKTTILVTFNEKYEILQIFKIYNKNRELCYLAIRLLQPEPPPQQPLGNMEFKRSSLEG